MPSLHKHTPIFFVGFMGAGKSTVGRYVADILGREFLDTDILIENRFRKRISDIFAEDGEALFRRRETHMIQEICSFHNVVIATGGGLPCHSDNMALLNESGITVYLQHSNEELAHRLEQCKRTRPSIKELSRDKLRHFIEDKMSVRQLIYEEAQMTINYKKDCPTNDEKQLARLIVTRLQESA